MIQLADESVCESFSRLDLIGLDSSHLRQYLKKAFFFSCPSQEQPLVETLAPGPFAMKLLYCCCKLQEDGHVGTIEQQGQD